MSNKIEVKEKPLDHTPKVGNLYRLRGQVYLLSVQVHAATGRIAPRRTFALINLWNGGTWGAASDTVEGAFGSESTRQSFELLDHHTITLSTGGSDANTNT